MYKRQKTPVILHIRRCIYKPFCRTTNMTSCRCRYIVTTDKPSDRSSSGRKADSHPVRLAIAGIGFGVIHTIYLVANEPTAVDGLKSMNHYTAKSTLRPAGARAVGQISHHHKIAKFDTTWSGRLFKSSAVQDPFIKGMSNGSSSQSRSHQKINQTNLQAARVLMQELQSLQKERTEGFTVKLVQEDNLFEWEAGIYGPPDTLYAGGYFKACMKFPPGYPFSPPTVHFLTKMWHPNVYANGSVCISILHPQTDNQRSGELPSERWNPTQNAYSVLMSIISLLNEPNTNSPANVEASIMYRRWKEKGDKEYEKIIKEQVEISRAEADKEGIQVPLTLAEYCVPKSVKVEPKTPVASISEFDFSDNSEPMDSYSDDEAMITNKPPSPAAEGSGNANGHVMTDIHSRK